MTAPRDRITLRRAAELAADLRLTVIRAHQVKREDAPGSSAPSYPYLVGCLQATLEFLVRDLGGHEAMALVRNALKHQPTPAELAMGDAELRTHTQPAAQHRPQRPPSPRRATVAARPVIPQPPPERTA